ncbi:hypothetical protein [Methylobacillus flagellatus]|uniref:hypothetical protein n=1 Tax=Methylobacillus flagellatus TaxID=405 RepID=UPI0010F56DDA|nr:hypothetical protein [Methylobacillus flagellatus]
MRHAIHNRRFIVMTGHALLLACLLCSLLAMPVQANPDEPADQVSIVSNSVRAVGYRIGDHVQQRLQIATPKGYQLDKASLPLGDSGAPVELQAVESHAVESKNTDQAEHSLHTLVLDWQLFRAMREVRPLPLQALTLEFRRGDAVLHVPVPAARIVVSPLLPTTLEREYVQPRADVAAQAIATGPLWQRFLVAALVLLLTLLYFAWRYDVLHLRRPQAPLRLAWRQLRRMPATQDEAAAMLPLRRALDQVAGTAISSERLDTLFQRCAWLLPLRAEITLFYVASDRVYFAAQASPLPRAALVQLARKLAMLESA